MRKADVPSAVELFEVLNEFIWGDSCMLGDEVLHDGSRLHRGEEGEGISQGNVVAFIDAAEDEFAKGIDGVVVVLPLSQGNSVDVAGSGDGSGGGSGSNGGVEARVDRDVPRDSSRNGSKLGSRHDCSHVAGGASTTVGFIGASSSIELCFTVASLGCRGLLWTYGVHLEGGKDSNVHGDEIKIARD